MSDPAAKELNERVARAADDLGEHADSVLIITTWARDGRDPGTVGWSYRGSTAAAIGMAEWFLERMKECARINARRDHGEEA